MSEDLTGRTPHLLGQSRRGLLKIVLGYAAGVGKTYYLLQEARRLKQDGADVVLGLVETRGLAETEALLGGLERVSPRRAHGGREAAELDVEAVLARRPAVVIVDDLASANAAGGRNTARWQDVEEILGAGIHVVASLNIQNLESLSEAVERATSLRVAERVPDRMLDVADQLVSVDITPEDLRRRLREGRVHAPEGAAAALEASFKTSSLELLRRLALRELAAQLDARRHGAPLAAGALSAPEPVVVGLSAGSPNSEALLRYGSRLAERLSSDWYAVHVQTAEVAPAAIDAATQRKLANAQTLALQLGATVFTYRGDDVADALLRFAEEYRAGHIVIGPEGRRPPLWRRLAGRLGLADRLASAGRGLTVVVHDAGVAVMGAAPADIRRAPAAAAAPAGGPAAGGASRERNVVVWHERLSKEDALRQLIEACGLSGDAQRRAAWDAVLARERQGVTFVGAGVALPHARLPGLERPAVALGLARGGLEVGPDGGEIRLVFLLLSPAEPAHAHVRALGRVCALARDERWLRRAAVAGRPSELADDLVGLFAPPAPPHGAPEAGAAM